MQTWLITGCSSGLGRCLAFEALRRGYNVVVTARNPNNLTEFSERYPGQALIQRIDVTKPEEIQQVIRNVGEAFGPIDVLVNNAGYGYRAAGEEGEAEAVERLFQTNLFGPITLTKAVLPDMRRRRSGAIVNIASVAAAVPFPGSGYYAATKSALESVSDAMRKELAPLNIRVMVVEPGAFRTDFSGRSLTQSATVIDDYAETAGKRRIGKENVHGKQPGDPQKGAALIVDTITGRKQPPFRLLLGSDAVKVVSQELHQRLDEMEVWSECSQSTDY